jgi:hypothetical protein
MLRRVFQLRERPVNIALPRGDCLVAAACALKDDPFNSAKGGFFVWMMV